MAIKHLANLNLNNNEIKNVRIDVVTSDPSGFGAAEEGAIIYNSASDLMKYWDGSSWISMKNTDTDVDVSLANLVARLPQITDDVTIGDATDVTITTSGDLTVTGDLTVNGSTTTVNTTELTIEDNLMTLNSGQTGTPPTSLRSGIEVERGDTANAILQFNENTDKWEFSTDGGSTFTDLGASPDSATTEAEGIVELATTAEAAEGTDISRAVTPAGLAAHAAAKSFVTSIGDGSATSYTVTHNLGTRDVMVQLYDNSSYDTVYADITRTSDNVVTVGFTSAPSSNDIRVLVTEIVAS